MEEKQRRVNVEEKERCALKKKTPLTVVSDLFLDLVTHGRFWYPFSVYLSVGMLGYKSRPVTLISFKSLLFLMCIYIYK